MHVSLVPRYRPTVEPAEPWWAAGSSRLGQTPPDVVMFDRGLLVNPTAPVVWNRGCPPGYFAQFVPPGAEGAVKVGETNWVRCRLLSTATPGTIARESGPSPSERVLIFAGEAARRVQESLQAAGEALKPGLTFLSWFLAAGIAVAVAGVVLVVRK